MWLEYIRDPESKYGGGVCACVDFEDQTRIIRVYYYSLPTSRHNLTSTPPEMIIHRQIEPTTHVSLNQLPFHSRWGKHKYQPRRRPMNYSTASYPCPTLISNVDSSLLSVVRSGAAGQIPQMEPSQSRDYFEVVTACGCSVCVRFQQPR